MRHDDNKKKRRSINSAAAAARCSAVMLFGCSAPSEMCSGRGKLESEANMTWTGLKCSVQAIGLRFESQRLPMAVKIGNWLHFEIKFEINFY